MCIAIYNESSTLDKRTLENSFDNNNQGAGLLWAENKKLKTFKTHKKNDLIKKYYEIRNKSKEPIVLHFRIATSGFTADNLHPFLVNDKLGFVHNGVIYGLGNKLESDTNQFNKILQGLPKDFLNNESTINLIQLAIDSDKLIFLDNTGVATIINEEFGHWDLLGNWFSNNSHQQQNNYKFYGNKKVYNAHNEDAEINALMDYYFVNDLQDLYDEIAYDGFNSIDEAIKYHNEVYTKI